MSDDKFNWRRPLKPPSRPNFEETAKRKVRRPWDKRPGSTVTSTLPLKVFADLFGVKRPGSG